LQGKVDRVISFDKDESWNDAIIVRNHFCSCLSTSQANS